jgi:hypothetical protein
MKSCNHRQTWFALNGPIVPPVAPLPLPDEVHPVSGDDHRIASVSQRGMTSAAPLPSFGQIAPKM